MRKAEARSKVVQQVSVFLEAKKITSVTDLAISYEFAAWFAERFPGFLQFQNSFDQHEQIAEWADEEIEKHNSRVRAREAYQ